MKTFLAICLIFALMASATPLGSVSVKANLPKEVIKAIEEGREIVEIQIDNEISRVYHIDYHKPMRLATSGTDCGTDSTAYKTLRLKWNSFPITYSIDANGVAQDVNSDGSTDANDASAARQAILNALNTWDAEEQPTGILFTEAQQAQVPIGWGEIDGPSGTLAITSVNYNKATRTIVSAAITYDSGDAWKVYPVFNCAKQGNAFDVEDVGAHELGHVVGLGHVQKSKDSAQTMYAYASPGETLKRTLGTGDKNGIASLY